MSVYTSQVRFICESAAGLTSSVGYNEIDNVLDKAVPAIFDFDFPIYDKAYKNVLARKILMHYYTREIGLETYGLWKLKLRTKLNEIMPYYNQLYESAMLKFNPLYDVDVKRTHNRTEEETRKSSGTTESDSNTNTTANGKQVVDGSVTTTVNNNHVDKYSATPQGSITDLQSDKYLTNARIITDNDTTTGTSGDTTTTDNTTDTNANSTTTTDNNDNINSTEDYIESVTGKQGTQSYASMILEYRKTLINIDMMIIDELSELFMNIWEVKIAW